MSDPSSARHSMVRGSGVVDVVVTLGVGAELGGVVDGAGAFVVGGGGPVVVEVDGGEVDVDVGAEAATVVSPPS